MAEASHQVGADADIRAVHHRCHLRMDRKAAPADDGAGRDHPLRQGGLRDARLLGADGDFKSPLDQGKGKVRIEADEGEQAFKPGSDQVDDAGVGDDADQHGKHHDAAADKEHGAEGLPHGVAKELAEGAAVLAPCCHQGVESIGQEVAADGLLGCVARGAARMVAHGKTDDHRAYVVSNCDDQPYVGHAEHADRDRCPP